ncbi:porin [Fulvimarina endophytica]|uniref:Porin n=1 Tax=Fulvimarina endophytica TaxID=2293836 RepID=A0A371X3G9_9HYPH|nr:porin [Fulvimarina endophytica]RFC63574.1 porin [Fulvimarina endophytica]
MNIKSLLLGSAAALVAVTGARAADVIVPMAEPTDYVRVCDVYGEGFYYIPGTETCLRVGGYVRFKYAVAGAVENDAGVNFLRNSEGDDYQAGTQVRVRLDFDAREETELGTLRAKARVQATNSLTAAYSNDRQYGMDQGFIQLGGLTMGYLDSLFTEDDGLLTDTDLPIGDIQTNRVSYTFAAAGLSATVGLEEDGSGDFAPNVVAKLGYSGGFGGFNLYGVYEESVGSGNGPLNDPAFTRGVAASTARTGFIDLNGNGRFDAGIDTPVFATTAATAASSTLGVLSSNDPDAFVLKANVSLKDLIAPESELRVEGSYAFDPSTYSTVGLFDNAQTLGNNSINPFLGDVASEWQVGAGYAQRFGKLGLSVAGIYGEAFENFQFNQLGTALVSDGGGDYYKFVGNVGYEITNNFDMLAEVSYVNLDLNGSNVVRGDSIDQTAGFVQFVRSF